MKTQTQTKNLATSSLLFFNNLLARAAVMAALLLLLMIPTTSLKAQELTGDDLCTTLVEFVKLQKEVGVIPQNPQTIQCQWLKESANSRLAVLEIAILTAANPLKSGELL